MTAGRALVLGLAVAAAAILAFSLVGGQLAAVGFTAVAAAFPFALMALGAARRGRLGRAAVPIAVAFVLVELAMLGMLALRGRVLEGPWLAGLPLAAALQLYGIFLLPLAVIALGFGLTFRRLEVDEEELERLRRLAPKGPS